jgi:hypothetical protein
MKRSSQVLVVRAVIASLLWLTPQILRADPPDIIGTYRFAPLRSTLVAIGNPDYELNIYGTFDFIRGWEYRSDPPPVSLVHYADFENVFAWAQNPLSLAPPLSLDGIFNLSGLIGEQLPTASIFDVYKFDGKNLRGDQVEVFVSVLGPWLYLRGETTFHDNADFGWQMNALARKRPFADFDEDGDVDGNDLALWQDRAGTWIGMNDANGDDFLTGTDFLLWQRQFGETPPDVATLNAAIDGALTASLSVAPEPATCAFVAGFMLFGLGFGRRL